MKRKLISFLLAMTVITSAVPCFAAADVSIADTEETTVTEPTTEEATEEATEEPTETPADVPVPDGTIDVKAQASNVATTQKITVDADGGIRHVAYATNNSSIWYLGNYDLSEIDSITMSLGLVTDSEGTMPQVKLAYMSLDGSEINADYIETNSGTIRSAANTVAIIEGKTEPSADTSKGHEYLGALYTVTSSDVTVDSASYAVYPGGTVTLGENSSALNTSKSSGEVALFVYATAQKRRATIDYVTITEKVGVPVPDGAIDVKAQASNVTTTQSISVDANGGSRNVAYTTNNSSIWYLGNYDLSEIKNITMSLGLVASSDGVMPQVKLAYMPLDGSEINADYITTNSGTIRSSANTVAIIEGKTEPSADTSKGHEYLGALYTVTSSSVTVDSASYAVYPGGTATVGENSSALNTTKSSGEVALFVYATAQKCRATIDYVTITKKVDVPVPDGVIDVKAQASNVTTTQSISVDANGGSRNVAYTTNNTSIWYLGSYDLSAVETITMRLGLVASDDATPQVKLAYMPLDGSEINADYIETNSGIIRSAANTVAIIEGKTEPSADASKGHEYLGALYTVTSSGVTVDSASYAVYPGGTATVGENSSALNTNKGDGEVALFVYATAQKCRVAIDYATITSRVYVPVPEGAIDVKSRISNTDAIQQITVDANGGYRSAASTTTNDSIWYLGDYDVSKIEKITMRLGLVTDSEGTMPQVKLAYMPLSDVEIDAEYVAENSKTIRSSANLIAMVEGKTEPSADASKGHEYLGALFELDTDGVRVSDDDTYSVYPGGTVTLGENSSALNAGKSDGRVALFIYGTAQKCRAAIDYVVIETSEVIDEPTEFKVEFGKATITDSGVSVAVTVTGEGSLDTVMYVAEYNGDTFTAVRKVDNISVSESGTISLPCEITDGANVKVFVWNSAMTAVTRPIVAE